MNKCALFASLVAFAITTPALAGDWTVPTVDWKDVKADLKDLHTDIKDLRADRAALDVLKDSGQGKSPAAEALRDQIHADKLDIHNDIKDLKHDFSKGRH